eukprot:SAG31_NODE_3116_length_4658_cov_2.625576_8_plen_52_part_00
MTPSYLPASYHYSGATLPPSKYPVPKDPFPYQYLGIRQTGKREQQLFGRAP